MPTLKVRVIAAQNLKNKDLFGKSDPFCVVQVGSSKFQTKHINNNLNPIWNEEANLLVKDPSSDVLNIVVYDYDQFSSCDALGNAQCSLSMLIKGKPQDVWLNLSTKGKVNVELTAIDFGFEIKQSNENQMQNQLFQQFQQPKIQPIIINTTNSNQFQQQQQNMMQQQQFNPFLINQQQFIPNQNLINQQQQFISNQQQFIPNQQQFIPNQLQNQQLFQNQQQFKSLNNQNNNYQNSGSNYQAEYKVESSYNANSGSNYNANAGSNYNYANEGSSYNANSGSNYNANAGSNYNYANEGSSYNANSGSNYNYQNSSPISNETLQGIVTSIKNESFADSKKNVLSSSIEGYSFKCDQVGTLLSCFDFSSDKLYALKILSSRITDKNNSSIIYNHFTFSYDKEEAKKYLGY